MSFYSKHKKSLAVFIPVVALIFAGIIVVSSNKAEVASQGKADFNTAVNIQIPARSCRFSMGPNGRPVPPAPAVTVTSPTANQTFVSGQLVPVTWTLCGIATNAQGILTLTKVSGTGQTTYGPFAITGSQSSFNVPIAALPGIYDGDANTQLGLYRATVAYGATTGTSANFSIQHTKTGLQIVWGAPNGSVTGNDSARHQLIMDTVVTVKAVGADIYIDKDVLKNVPLSTTGAQIATFTQGINNGSNPMTPTAFTSTFVSGPTFKLSGSLFGQPAFTQNAQTLTNTYLLRAGQQQVLDISSVVQVPPGPNCAYSIFSQFSFALSDINGNMSEPLEPMTYRSSGGCFYQ